MITLETKLEAYALVRLGAACQTFLADSCCFAFVTISS